MRKTAWVVATLMLMVCCGGSPPKAEKREPAAAKPARITQFYAGEPAIPKGGKTLLCYGVENATSVRIAPPVESLSVSPNRCFEVHPTAATTYTLTAEGADGSRNTATLTVEVTAARAPAPATKAAAPGPLISRFSQEQKAGVVLLCYEADRAEAVAIEPGALARTSAVRGCLGVAPKQATTYTLKAFGPHGHIETRALSVNPVQ